MVDISNQVTVTFKGDNAQLAASLKRTNSSLVRLRTTIAGLQQATQQFTAVARRGFILLAASITATLIPFSRFEDGITNVNTLLSGTTEEVERAKNALETLAKETLRDTKFSIGDVTKSLFDLVSALGFTKDSADIFRAAQRLAIAGVTSLNTAVIAITSSLNAYKGILTDAEKVGRIFFVGQKFGATTVEKLALNIGKISPIAKQAGFSLQETVAAIAQLTLGGLNTEIAVTALRQAINSLLNPSKTAEEAFRRLGIPFGATALKGIDMADVLGLIAKAAREGGAEITEMFGNIRAQTAIGSLDTKALENYSFILNEVRTDTESLNRAVLEQEGVLSTAIAKLRNSLSLFAITLGTELSPKIINVSDNIRKFALAMGQLKPGTINKVAKALLNLAFALGALVVVGQAATIMLGIVKAFAGLALVLTGPVGAGIAVAIGAITLALAKFEQKSEDLAQDDKKKGLAGFFRGLKDSVQDLRDTWKALNEELSKPILPTEGEGENPVVTGLAGISEGAIKAKDDLTEMLDTLAETFKSLRTEIVDGWTSTIDGLLKGTKTFGDAVIGMFESILHAFTQLVAKMAANALFKFVLSAITGGAPIPLPSFDVGSSNVPQDMTANIHKGEIITPPKASQGIRDGNLALVNTSRLQDQNNNLLESLIAKVDNLSARPIQIIADFGESQMDIFSRQVEKADFRREQFAI